jgi:hypothetical protein
MFDRCKYKLINRLVLCNNHNIGAKVVREHGFLMAIQKLFIDIFE